MKKINYLINLKVKIYLIFLIKTHFFLIYENEEKFKCNFSVNKFFNVN